jgi:hypothetical protein
MFGPLNGVRVALVAAAVIAALLGAIFGQWVMTGLLLAGVALHGWGWWYLYKRHVSADSTSESAPVT